VKLDRPAGIGSQVKLVIEPFAVVAPLPNEGVDPHLTLVEDEQVLDIAREAGLLEAAGQRAGWALQMAWLAADGVEPKPQRRASGVGGDGHRLTRRRVAKAVVLRPDDAQPHGALPAARPIAGIASRVGGQGHHPVGIALKAPVADQVGQTRVGQPWAGQTRLEPRRGRTARWGHARRRRSGIGDEGRRRCNAGRHAGRRGGRRRRNVGGDGADLPDGRRLHRR
jgi:hypothetical protein